MVEGAFDVAAIGNAIVDVLAHTDDSLLSRIGVTKGVMTLIDASQAEAIYGALPPAVECSGGSAANTVAGIASLGGKAAFMGKVKNDQLGAVFRHDLNSIGVTFTTAPANDGPSTARCMVMVTPDAQRTMQTYLGAAVELSPSDVDAGQIASAKITYLEGYLWDPPAAKQAFLKATELAHAAGRKVALSLSDPFCVDRHREDFLSLIDNHVDILFANEAEIMALYQCDFGQAVARAKEAVDIAAITRGAQGSVVVSGDTQVRVAAEKIERLVDTTGAGDLYAAGFLFGLTRNYDLGVCARLGGICAAEVISHMGPRPETNLARLVASAQLLQA
jgi:sugar/nucleoside kinase (ribokinase family)